MENASKLQKKYRSRRFVRLKDLQEFFGVWNTTIYRWIKKRGFPNPYKPGPNTSLWDMDEVEEWILSSRKLDSSEKS